MPKELTHWEVANEALKQIKEYQIVEIITANPHLYYLGAIAHDIPFYDLSHSPQSNIEWIGNQLHGTMGENTLVPLTAMMDRALEQSDRIALLSFMMGMLTHYFTDSTFHPFVYYHSGNYFSQDSATASKAVFRHRLLETAIDLWFEAERPLSFPQNLDKLWRSSGALGAKSLDLLIDYYALEGNPSVRAYFKSAWRYHRLLQIAFKWSVPSRVLSFYQRFGVTGLEKHDALFYTQHLNLSIFQTVFAWQHPVTGKENTLTLGQLFDQSVANVVKLFKELGKHPLSRWPGVLRRQEPLALDSGLPFTPASKMKFFSPDAIEIKLHSKEKN